MATKANGDSGSQNAETEAEPGIGHNSNTVHKVTKKQLRSFVERIERVEEEQQALAADKTSIYAEAKGQGYDTKALRRVIRERRQDPAERQEQEMIAQLYRDALGMVSLYQAAAEAEAGRAEA